MKRRTSSVEWIAGTAVVCVLVLVASWLLLLGPLLERAAVTRAQAADLTVQNDTLRASVDALRADFANLGAYEAELAALRRGLPAQARLSDLTREIATAATAAGVTVVGMDQAPASELTGQTATAPPPVDGTTSDGAAPATDAGAADAATTDTATTDTAAPDAGATTGTAGPLPGPPPVTGMVAIPLTIGVVGSVDPVRSFLAAIQTGLDRQLLVTTLRVEALEEGDAGESRPATRIGDVEATIGAYAYVLPEAGSTGSTEVAGPLPPSNGVNPFAPSVAAPAAVPAPAPDPAASVAAAVATAIAEASAAGQAAAAAAAAASAAQSSPAPAAPSDGTAVGAGTSDGTTGD